MKDRTMKICLVEDDYLQADWICTEIKGNFPRVNVDIINTEQKFRLQFPRFIKTPPLVFVIDVMLRWTDPAPGAESAPVEVMQNGFYRAGIRCARMLMGHPRTANTKIILYTVLEENDLEREIKGLNALVMHIRKDADLTPLMAALSEV